MHAGIIQAHEKISVIEQSFPAMVQEVHEALGVQGRDLIARLAVENELSERIDRLSYPLAHEIPARIKELSDRTHPDEMKNWMLDTLQHSTPVK